MKIEIEKVTNYMEFDEVRETLVWEGTEDEIFKRFDKENNRLRYVNDTHYKFKTNKVALKYRKWLESLSTETRFKMYYGNGTVD